MDPKGLGNCIIRGVLIGMLMILVGCASSGGNGAHRDSFWSWGGKQKAGGKKPGSAPYQVNGVWYQPLASARGFRQKGIASWYGEPFHGRPTSSGEIYNMYAISAAHKILPLGTVVRVRNLENSKTLVLRVNDRGPFIPGRVIDLSYGAAQALNIVGAGTAMVEIQAVGESPFVAGSAQKRSPPPGSNNRGNYLVQVGAFEDRNNAEKLANDLLPYYQGVKVARMDVDQNMYRVVVGHGASREKACQYAERLRAQGFSDVFMASE